MKRIKTKSQIPVIDIIDEVEEHDSGFEREDSPPDTDTSRDEEVEDDREGSPIPEGQYEVEEIRDYMRDKLGELYQVKWKGWGEEHNTWEPPSSLLNCQEALVTFFLKRRAEIEKNASSEPEYIPSENGNKRRRGSHVKLCLPPDPSPLGPRAKAFYDATHYPSTSEIKEWEALWRSDFQKSLLANAKGKKPNKNDFTPRWRRVELDRGLVLVMKGHRIPSDADKDLRKQLFLQEKDELREIASDELKDWEEELNEISERKPQLTVENRVDWEGPPKDFTYINDYVPTGDIIIPNDPILGCSCTDCFSDRKDCCPAPFNAHFAYTNHKKVRVMAGTPIYECNNKCECGPDCPNRVVQDGRVNIAQLALCIFRTANGRGWGVKTLKKINKNTFVSLYLGEIITSDEAEKRGKEYDRNGCTYLFDLDINEGKESNRYTVDAAKYGNITHFINHSCDPNLAVFSVFVNCVDPDLPKLALFATRDIARGEELSFDYEYQVIADPEPEDEGRLKQPCYCGSDKCRKYFF